MADGEVHDFELAFDSDEYRFGGLEITEILPDGMDTGEISLSKSKESEVTRHPSKSAEVTQRDSYGGSRMTTTVLDNIVAAQGLLATKEAPRDAGFNLA